MSLKKIIFFYLSLLCFNNQSFSITSLQWKDVVRKFQENNEEVQSAQQNLNSAKSDLKKSYSGYFPKISGSLVTTESDFQRGSWSRSYGAQLNLNQNIFAGFIDTYRVEVAQKKLNLAEVSFQNTKSMLSSELIQIFVTVLYAKKYKILTESILKRRRDNFDNVQLQFQSGRENKGSVLLSESYVEQSQYDELQAQHNKDIALEELKRILGLPPLDDVEVQPDAIYKNEIENYQVASNIDFEKIVEQHPEVKMQEAQMKSSYLNYKMEQSNFYPSLDLTGNYGYTDTKFFPEPYHWSVGLSLNIPLFDGGRDYYSTKSSYAKYLSAESEFKNKRRSILINIKSAYNTYLEAQQKEKVDLSFLKASEVRAQIARSKYKNGLMSFDDWDLIENDLILKQKTSLASQRDKIIKLAQWQQSQGLGVFNESNQYE